MSIAAICAYLGSALAVGLGAIGSGWGIGYAGNGAVDGMARQPNQQAGLFRNMLINQAIASNPSIFALVISLVLLNIAGGQITLAGNWGQAMAYLGAGLCIGLGSLGSGAGSGIVAYEALQALSRTPRAQPRVTLFMLVGQAWCQTPCIFALVISLVLTVVMDNFGTTQGEILVSAARMLGMGLAMGAGAIGSAIGIAFVSSRVCRGVADAPEAESNIRNALFVGAAVAESPAVFALIISLILMSVGAS